MTFIFTLLISAAFAEEPTSKPITFIDFEEVELNVTMTKPALTLITGDRAPAKPDILIIDLRQEVLDMEIARNQETK